MKTRNNSKWLQKISEIKIPMWVGLLVAFVLMTALMCFLHSYGLEAHKLQSEAYESMMEMKRAMGK